ncbi:hypothetical protein LTR92_001268 [Exophiala xenobiotica]|nr:hypothetical protein LTR92_001268 [Exophiala xenobiotica]
MLGVADRDVEDNLIFEEPGHDEKAAMWNFQKTEESMQKPPAIGFVPRALDSNPQSSEAPVENEDIEMTTEEEEAAARIAEKKLMTALMDLHNEGIRHHQYSSSEFCLNATPDYLMKFIRQPGHADPVPFRLMPHQREGVGFALQLYKKGYGGCCWADDPGLGKTLQTIVVPAGLLDKWKEDLTDFLNTNHPKFPNILIYYGDGRKGKWEENLKDFDIIVTTYNIVKSEQRDYEAHRRQKWQHMRPEAEFDHEAVQLAAGNVQMRPGHDTTPLLAFPRGPYQGQWPLANIQFHILTLDEVHELRNHDTQSFNAIINLDAKFVSAVSGSRLNNSYEDRSTVQQAQLGKTQELSKWYIKPEEADPEPWIKCEQDTQKLTERIWKKTTSAAGSMSQNQPSNDNPDTDPFGNELPEFKLNHVRRACLGASHYAAPYAAGTIFNAEAEAHEDDDQYVEDAPVQGRAKQDYDWMLEQMRAGGSRYQSTKLHAAVEVVAFSLQREQHRLEALYLSYGTYRE